MLFHPLSSEQQESLLNFPVDITPPRRLLSLHHVMLRAAEAAQNRSTKNRFPEVDSHDDLVLDKCPVSHSGSPHRGLSTNGHHGTEPGLGEGDV